MRGTRWTPERVGLLRKMYRHRATNADMAAALDTTLAAIKQAVRHWIGTSGRKTEQYRASTPDEMKRLCQLWNDGVAATEIATKLGRNSGSAAWMIRKSIRDGLIEARGHRAVKRALTAGEIDVLRWMRAKGDSKKQIASALGVDMWPVERQVRQDGPPPERQLGSGRIGTDEERALLARLHSEGMSGPDKAEALGRTLRSTVRLLNQGLREGWVQKSPRYWPPADKSLLVELRAAGLSNLEISVRMNRTQRSVKDQIRLCLQKGLLTARYDDEKFAERAGVPVSALADYRFLRGKRIPAAEAAAMCQAARS